MSVSTATATDVLHGVKWRVAPEMPWLVGRDYAHLCETCKAAIDQAAEILPVLEPWGPMYDPEDTEVPYMFAYDQGWLCGGHRSDCAHKDEKQVVYWPVVTVDDYDGSFKRVTAHPLVDLPLVVNVADWWALMHQVIVPAVRALDSQGRATFDSGGATAVIEHGDGTWTEITFRIVAGDQAEFDEAMASGGWSDWHRVEFDPVQFEKENCDA